MPTRIPAQDLRLTLKEREVTALVAEGLRNSAIGARVGTTEQVVKNILRLVYDKAGVDNRTELALWYVAHEKGKA